MAGRNVILTAVPGIPLIEPGDDLGAILIGSLKSAGIAPRDSDVLVIAQKIVSKAEGRYIDLRTVVPSASRAFRAPAGRPGRRTWRGARCTGGVPPAKSPAAARCAG